MAETSGFEVIMQILEAELGKPVAIKIANLIKKRLPKERVYIPARMDVEIDIKDTPKTIQKKTGVSRATAYNLFKRRTDKFRI
jgi:hypothetical protein